MSIIHFRHLKAPDAVDPNEGTVPSETAEAAIPSEAAESSVPSEPAAPSGAAESSIPSEPATPSGAAEPATPHRLLAARVDFTTPLHSANFVQGNLSMSPRNSGNPNGHLFTPDDHHIVQPTNSADEVIFCPI
jgi:hypothetical protein